MPPLLENKNYAAPSVFSPEGLLREARRQKQLPEQPVPAICLLDPDGDIVRQLSGDGTASLCPAWACYHTSMHRFTYDGLEIGVVGCAVGSAFAVLVAEQMFASGCELLLSVTSSGQITPVTDPPYFILIDRAVRDEGTSYHYLPPSEHSHLPALLSPVLGEATSALAEKGFAVLQGATWTTDAPFRETAEAIEHHRQNGVVAVEMEAAALYAFAEARQKSVICVAHVTNQMANISGDFEKGVANGVYDALSVVSALATAWRKTARTETMIP
ncbi:MAG: nucleoside phosphorylase [Fibrella sp.]|nr:nucleoside phosphorylase [Armatimonadota bacterium]